MWRPVTQSDDQDNWQTQLPQHVRLLNTIQAHTGWSQAKIGYELGVSRHTIMRWQNGQIEPFPHKLHPTTLRSTPRVTKCQAPGKPPRELVARGDVPVHARGGV